MKTKLVTLLFVTMSTLSYAQKIAHADINAILSVMPENKRINDDLRIYATGLSKMVGDKKAQLEAVVQQFNQTLGAGDTLKAVELQRQGLELDKEVQEANTNAEQQLQQKRSEMMKPVLERIRKAMEKVATKQGFECVLNSVDGSGTSVYLWGPESADITRAVVKELGIKLEGSDKNPEPEKEEKKKKK
jgi:outer membrane protein